jgi:hypothetical protein
VNAEFSSCAFYLYSMLYCSWEEESGFDYDESCGLYMLRKELPLLRPGTANDGHPSFTFQLARPSLLLSCRLLDAFDDAHMLDHVIGRAESSKYSAIQM